MSAVRVRVVLGDLNLFFEGQEAFFTEHVQPLLEGAYRALGDEAELPPVESPPQDAQPSSHGVEAPKNEGAEPAEAPEVEDPEPGFEPASRQFSSFVQRVGSRAPKPDQQVMAFAFYLWNYERRASFQPDELVGCFRALALDVPEPMDERLQVLCSRKRFLRPHAQSGGFELTPKGVNYVKNRLLADA